VVGSGVWLVGGGLLVGGCVGSWEGSWLVGSGPCDVGGVSVGSEVELLF